MKNIKELGQALVEECQKFDESIEITFDHSEITIYWKSLRIDCSPATLAKGLSAIRQLETLGARFE